MTPRGKIVTLALDDALLRTISCDAPLLVGVSGGRDSVALLHALAERGYRHAIVCHLDHSLRPESAEDASFVATLAASLGFDAVIQRDEVRALARRTKQSLEAAARTARYAFFARAARARDCPRLLLAHHADDQVETVLHNLFRGTGTHGLGGMAPHSTHLPGGVMLQIFRPLLGTWRAEIDAWITARGFPFREDASNADALHTRNRLRRELLPAIAAIVGRDVRRAVHRMSEMARAEDQWMSAAPELQAPPAELSVAALRPLPIALQRRLLQGWLRAGGIAHAGFEEVESVRALLAGGRPAKVNLARGCHARRQAGRLFLTRPA